MAEMKAEAGFLGSITILTPGRRFALGREVPVVPPQAAEPGTPPGTGAPQQRRSLAAEAMRWSYVLRSRERWLDNPAASTYHEQDATATLNHFGLTPRDIQQIALAEQVVVRMPYPSEGVGWDGRIFPWEYVIAAATRRYRHVLTGPSW